MDWLSRTDNLLHYPAIIFLGQYHLFLVAFLDEVPTDFKLCRRILDDSLGRYPNSSIFR